MCFNKCLLLKPSLGKQFLCGPYAPAVRFFEAGAEPVAVIAIGANATGVIAVGQLATGVVAIGQLARGVVVVGQLGLGFITFGQLVCGVVWAGGQLGIGGTMGPGLVYGPFGHVDALALFRRRSGPAWRHEPLTQTRFALGLLLVLAMLALWWLGAGQWLTDAITRTGGIFNDPPRKLR
jgi:hypothetical protein